MVASVRRVVRWEGPLGLVARLAGRFGIRVCWWLTLDKDRLPDPSLPPDGCEVRELGLDDLDRLDFDQDGTPAAQSIERLRSGNRCFAVVHAGRVVGMTWYARQRARVHALRRDLILAPDEGYLFNSSVAPAWRGRRLHHLMMVHLAALTRADGASRLGCLIEMHNRSSLRSRRRSGFVPQALLVTLDLGPIHRLWWRGEFRGELIRRAGRDAGPAAGPDEAPR